MADRYVVKFESGQPSVEERRAVTWGLFGYDVTVLATDHEGEFLVTSDEGPFGTSSGVTVSEAEPRAMSAMLNKAQEHVVLEAMR